MPTQTTVEQLPRETPFRAIAARKRNAAQRHEDKAADYRREADELDAQADRLGLT